MTETIRRGLQVPPGLVSLQITFKFIRFFMLKNSDYSLT